MPIRLAERGGQRDTASEQIGLRSRHAWQPFCSQYPSQALSQHEGGHSQQPGTMPKHQTPHGGAATAPHSPSHGHVLFAATIGSRPSTGLTRPQINSAAETQQIDRISTLLV